MKRKRAVKGTDKNPQIPTKKPKRVHYEVDSLPPNQDHDHHDINSLLDFTPSCSHDAISARFDFISYELISKYYLSIVHDSSQTDYEILELEFYLQKPDYHDDPFTHGSPEQERGAQWYFHRVLKHSNGSQNHNIDVTPAGGYRGGTRKGLDFTLGNTAPTEKKTASSRSKSPEKSLSRGGVLLRTIRRCHDKTVISGPSLIVDEILRLSGASNIQELVSVKWKGDISALSAPSQSRSTYMSFRKRPPSNFATSRIFYSPRVGLDLSNPECKATPTHPRVIFLGKLYRHFIHPELLNANGRYQTFIGLYLTLVEEKDCQPHSLKLCQELSTLTGMMVATIIKYLLDYRLGFEKGKLERFVGSPGKGVSSSSSSYLRMMGTLARTLQESS